MIYLYKVLPALISPLALVIYFIALSLFVKTRWPRIVALLLLFSISNPLIGRQTMQILERHHPPIDIATLPEMKTVVVLGGIMRTVSLPNGEIKHDFMDTVDRFETALNLIEMGRTEQIIFTRGQLPWSIGPPEGEILHALALRRGLQEDQVQLTDIAANTAQEARAVKRLLGEERQIGLITSAFHMPRAQRLFENEGFVVTPIAVDHRAELQGLTLQDFLPDAEALVQTSLFWREMLGRAYYTLKY